MKGAGLVDEKRFASLTFKSIRARPVVLKLERPVVARIATITDWPLILIDLYTEEGIVGSVDEAGVRPRASDLAEDGQPAEPGIEDENGRRRCHTGWIAKFFASRKSSLREGPAPARLAGRIFRLPSGPWDARGRRTAIWRPGVAPAYRASLPRACGRRHAALRGRRRTGPPRRPSYSPRPAWR